MPLLLLALNYVLLNTFTTCARGEIAVAAATCGRNVGSGVIPQQARRLCVSRRGDE